MTEELPTPKSRKEEYLAKAAGMEDIELPEPASREEQYLNAIAEGGGGSGTSDFDQITNRPKYDGVEMTSETDIPLAPTVVQTAGSSETDVMSQKATTQLVYHDTVDNPDVGDRKFKIGIGQNLSFDNIGGIASHCVNVGYFSKVGASAVSIGSYSQATGGYSIAIGNGDSAALSANALASDSAALGSRASVSGSSQGSVALGSGAKATFTGQVDIGTTRTNWGYNSTNYRRLTGLYDGQDIHEAATVAQGNTLATSAPTTSTVGVLGQLYTDTTNMHTYQCTAISGDTYTWTQRW